MGGEGGGGRLVDMVGRAGGRVYPYQMHLEEKKLIIQMQLGKI